MHEAIKWNYNFDCLSAYKIQTSHKMIDSFALFFNTFCLSVLDKLTVYLNDFFAQDKIGFYFFVGTSNAN